MNRIHLLVAKKSLDLEMASRFVRVVNVKRVNSADFIISLFIFVTHISMEHSHLFVSALVIHNNPNQFWLKTLNIT